MTAPTKEKITTIRLSIAIPALVLSYLCLISVPILVMLTIAGRNGAALTAGGSSPTHKSHLLLEIPFITGSICALVALVVSPGWRSRLAALFPTLCYFGFIAFLSWAFSHMSK
jgi:hypothetical protein